MLERPPHSDSASRNRRRLPRVPETGATAIIEGTNYPLEDWNPKGFMIAPYEGRCGVGALLSVTLVIPFGSKSYKLVTKAKVVRRNKSLKQLAAVFTGVDVKTATLLTQLTSVKLWVPSE